ncbi:MAG: HAD-IA family hydrolase [Treponema sp.]|nr:HAD-IA family hydrolase [Treponema sp.]
MIASGGGFGQGHQLVKGALELCRTLSRDYRLFIITNGVAKTQHERIDASGLVPYMEKVFISDEIGYDKPAKGFFDHVASNIEGFDPERALVIGDALFSDIKGGMDYGLDTCYLNIYNSPNTSEIKPTYEIRTITGLYDLLSD